MKICSKCEIEKESNEYYTYWHSTYNKHFTRNICNDCMRKQSREVKARIKERKLHLKEERKEMIEVLTQQEKLQPVVPELEPVVLEDNPNNKKCKMCEKFLPLTDFYQNIHTGYYHSRCKNCHRNYSTQKQKDYYQDKYKTKGGSERVLIKPNHYTDIYQEQQTHWVMKLMGWTFNENGVWSKEGIKDKDNVWDKVPTKPKEIKKRRPKSNKRVYDVEKIVILRKSGLLLREIAHIMGCSKPTIRKILIKEGEKQN